MRDMVRVADHMNEVFCANVYDEARQIANAGFRHHQRDLFMEQSECIYSKAPLPTMQRS